MVFNVIIQFDNGKVIFDYFDVDRYNYVFIKCIFCFFCEYGEDFVVVQYGEVFFEFFIWSLQFCVNSF